MCFASASSSANFALQKLKWSGLSEEVCSFSLALKVPPYLCEIDVGGVFRSTTRNRPLPCKQQLRHKECAAAVDTAEGVKILPSAHHQLRSWYSKR